MRKIVIHLLDAAPDVKPGDDNLRQTERLIIRRFVARLPIAAAENDEQQQILICPRLKMQAVEKTQQNERNDSGKQKNSRTARENNQQERAD